MDGFADGMLNEDAAQTTACTNSSRAGLRTRSPSSLAQVSLKASVFRFEGACLPHRYLGVPCPRSFDGIARDDAELTGFEQHDVGRTLFQQKTRQRPPKESLRATRGLPDEQTRGNGQGEERRKPRPTQSGKCQACMLHVPLSILPDAVHHQSCMLHVPCSILS